MKLSEELNILINNQITHERRNQALYLQIASYFEDMQLTNIAKFFFKQASDENDHAKLLIDHLNNRVGGKVSIQTVEFPVLSLNNIGEIASYYLKLEEGTTFAIESIYKRALESGSYIDLGVLSKLLKEQVEEEDTASKFVLQVTLCKDLVLYNNTFSL
jgi:ferritin